MFFEDRSRSALNNENQCSIQTSASTSFAFAHSARAKVNHELSSSSPQSRHNSDVPGHYSAFFDGYPCIGIHLLFEFLLLGRIGRGVIFWYDWFCNVFEGEERLAFLKKCIRIHGGQVGTRSGILYCRRSASVKSRNRIEQRYSIIG